ncbi:MAG: YdcF family protein [Acidobacteriaceae bacterium]
MQPRTRILFFLCVMVFTAALVIGLAYATLPTRNTSLTRFDTLVVLGYPALGDGSPSPEMRERVLEGVRQYKAGIAQRIIFTGGAAHNAFPESDAMARLALQQGVPPEAVLRESQAKDTIQNIYYSAQLMRRNGWKSAEIISSGYHLPRTGMIVNALNTERPSLSIQWRTHAAPWPPEYSYARRLALYAGEAWNCWLLRFKGLPSSQFLPSHEAP